MITWLAHGRIRLALHTLKRPAGPPLLLLHGLGESSDTGAEYESWPGSVHALDFTGHGASTVPAGGGYTAEVLMADADCALGHLGPSTIVGRGLGGYVALLIAGARPAEVRGAVIRDGPGLVGGSPTLPSPVIRTPDPGATSVPDPFALSEMAGDIRPTDYATAYARQATHLSSLDWPVSVCARSRPPWLAAVVEEPGVRTVSLGQALAEYAAIG